MSKISLKMHPEFPFRPRAEASLSSLAGGFLHAPDPASPASRLLNEFVVLVHRFTFLERLMQGDVLYQLPVHLQHAASSAATPEEDGESLAAAERSVLDWLGNDASALPTVIDDMGIKVLALDTNDEEETNSPPEDLCGAFLYLGHTGPALLVGTERTRPEVAFILAHEFAHLVADVNPYQARFCRWLPGTLENVRTTPEETRADRFARALLLPESRLRQLWSDIGGAGESKLPDDDQAEQLAAFFEVPISLLRLRLADLLEPDSRPRTADPGLVHPDRGLPERARARPQESDVEARLYLPERFVNLAIAIYSRGIMEVDELALFLRTTPEGAQEMLDWAHIHRRDLSREDAFAEDEDPSTTIDTPGNGR